MMLELLRLPVAPRRRHNETTAGTHDFPRSGLVLWR
jgi:hypothetical protein